MITNPEVCAYHAGRVACVLVRCDDCKGGPIRGLRTRGTFRFYADRPRVAVTAGINPPGWTRGMWRRLARLVRDHGWEAASHSMHHPRLPDVDPASLRRELVDSRDAILAHLQRAGAPVSGVPTLIYPFGAYGEREVAAARDAGYVLGLSYRTEEGVVRVPDRGAWLEWGYTLDAPETLATGALLERLAAVRAEGGVFSVTTHPPVVRPDRRWRSPNVYAAGGSWARFLDRATGDPELWFTTFGTLAAYRAQAADASLAARDEDALELRFERVAPPLPACPLSVACSVDREPRAVRLAGRDLPRLPDGPRDRPVEGWHFHAGRLVVSVASAGRIELRFG